MSSNSRDAVYRRVTTARIEFQEKKFEKLKLKHLGCDVERRRLERKLELINDENEELKRELGFLKDANARAIERYVLTSENNRKLEAELGELKAVHLACDFERRRLERELEFKNDKLDDLTKELRFSKDVEAKAIARCVKGLEYDREFEAKVDELRRGFNDERARLWGKLKDFEVRSKNRRNCVIGNLRDKFGIVFQKNEQVETGTNLKADPVCDPEISDSDDVESSCHVGGLRRARASSVCAIGKHIDDSSSGASDHLQHPRQPNKRFFVRSEYQTVIVEGKIPLTIDSLKSKIEDKLGIPRHHQRIVLEEEHVIDYTFARRYNNKEPAYPISTHLSVYRDTFGDDDDRTWVVDTSYGSKEVSDPDEPDFYAEEFEQYKRELQEQEQLYQEQGNCS